MPMDARLKYSQRVLASCKDQNDPQVASVAKDLAAQLAIDEDDFVLVVLPEHITSDFSVDDHIAQSRRFAEEQWRDEEGLGREFYYGVERKIGWMSAHVPMTDEFQDGLRALMKDAYWEMMRVRVESVVESRMDSPPSP